MRWKRSLRARLLRYLLGAIVLTVAAQATIAYLTALSEANEIFDYQMEQTALSLRYGLPLSGSERRVPPPTTDRDDDFIVQVWSADGQPVFKSIDLPELPKRTSPGYSDVNAQGTQYRSFVAESTTHIIQVSQDLAVRREMARTLALRTTLPVAVVAPFLMLVVWWVVSASLAPVSRLRHQVAQRQADDLSEVGDSDLPDEIRPLIQELNLLFRRLRQAFDAQKSFVADAAHELRSPLAALKLQIQALDRTTDDRSRQLAMSRLSAGIDRATHLVEQRLALARQQASATNGGNARPVALLDIARLELGDAANSARARQIDVGLIRSDNAIVIGHYEALRILVRNLLDNAIKFTPAGGTVNLEVVSKADCVELNVEDSGPGIPIAERERALDRFYRISGSESSGSGLGLAIVKAVADMHGATLFLCESKHLGGLRAELRMQSPGT
jgi:two-component system OmpR family sensor kinase